MATIFEGKLINLNPITESEARKWNWTRYYRVTIDNSKVPTLSEANRVTSSFTTSVDDLSAFVMGDEPTFLLIPTAKGKVSIFHNNVVIGGKLIGTSGTSVFSHYSQLEMTDLVKAIPHRAKTRLGPHKFPDVGDFEKMLTEAKDLPWSILGLSPDEGSPSQTWRL